MDKISTGTQCEEKDEDVESFLLGEASHREFSFRRVALFLDAIGAWHRMHIEQAAWLATAKTLERASLEQVFMLLQYRSKLQNELDAFAAFYTCGLSQLSQISAFAKMYGEESEARRTLQETHSREALQLVLLHHKRKVQLEVQQERLFLWTDMIEARFNLLNNELDEEEQTERVQITTEEWSTATQRFDAMRRVLQQAKFKMEREKSEKQELEERSKIRDEMEPKDWSGLHQACSADFEDAKRATESRHRVELCVQERDVRRTIEQEFSRSSFEALASGTVEFETGCRDMLAPQLLAQLHSTLLAPYHSIQCGFVEEDEATTRTKLTLEEEQERVEWSSRWRSERLDIRTREAVLQTQRFFYASASVRDALEKKRRRDLQLLAEMTVKRNNAVSIVHAQLRHLVSLSTQKSAVQDLARRVVSSCCLCWLSRHRLYRTRQAKRWAAVCLLQRCGRGFLFRDSFGFDWAIATAQRQANQRRRLRAAMRIVWAFRAHFSRAMWQRQQHEANVMRIRSTAAVVTQCCFRRLIAKKRKAQKLVERRREQLLQMQRVCRAGLVRERMRQQLCSVILQSFTRGKLAAVVVYLRSRRMPAMAIQRAARNMFARMAMARARARRNLSIEKRMKENAAVTVQKTYKCHSCRTKYLADKAARQAAHLAALESKTAPRIAVLQRTGRSAMVRWLVSRRHLRLCNAIGAVTAVLRSMSDKQQIRTIERNHRQREEALRREAQVVAMQSTLRSKLSYSYGIEICHCLAAKHAAQVDALRRLQRVLRGYATRRVLCIQQQRIARGVVCAQSFMRAAESSIVADVLRHMLLQSMKSALQRRSARSLQRWWRSQRQRRMAAVMAIQRLFLRQREKARKRRELRAARAAFYHCAVRDCVREELVSRTSISQTQTELFCQLVRDHRAASASLGIPPPPSIKIPQAFEEEEKQQRLRITVQAIEGYRTLFGLRSNEWNAARIACEDRMWLERRLRCEQEEEIIRSRIGIRNIETRRALRLQLVDAISSCFADMQTALYTQSLQERGEIEKARLNQVESVALQASKLNIMAQEQVKIVQTAALPSPPPSRQDDHPGREETHDGSTETCASAPVPPPSGRKLSALRRATPSVTKVIERLRAFSLAEVPRFTAISDSELKEITYPDAASANTAPPPSTSRVTITAEGCIDLRGTGACDEWVEAVCAKADSVAVVTGFNASGCLMTGEGVWAILQHLQRRQCPVACLDLSLNPQIGDVTALQLSHLISKTPSLTAISLSGTSVSVAKRQLLQYLLDERSSGKHSDAGMVAAPENPSEARAFRIRPLLFPRRK